MRAQRAASEQVTQETEYEDQTQIIRTITPEVKTGGQSSCDCNLRGNRVGPKDEEKQVLVVACSHLFHLFLVQDEDENSSYLKFGAKKVNGVSEDPRSISTILEPEEGVVKVKEINGKHPGSRPSSVPHLPSISNNRTTSGGLRKLQVHLAKVQGENSKLEVVEEGENESATSAES